MPALYGILSLVLVAGAVAFALNSPPPSTPPLAEVAPAPQEQVEVERVEQASQFGEGSGAEGQCAPGEPGCEGEPDGPGDGDADRVEVIERADHANLRPCVIGPGGPRQTEDPQSPPCRQEIFHGDNGGATSRGVTRQSIRIAIATPLQQSWADSNAASERASDLGVIEAFAAHVNRHYELFGRQLEIVEVERPGEDDPAAQRAFARQVAAAEPFAVLSWDDGGLPFHRALAVAGIVSLTTRDLTAEEAYDPLHPYLWGTVPSIEESLGASGALACQSLNGRAAQHGGAGVRDQTRRFGVVQEVIDGAPVPIASLLARLVACNAPHTTRTFDPEGGDRRVTMQSMADDGVTTVICACSSYRFWQTAAGTYEPEWLLPGLAATASSESISGIQAEHTFGLVPRLREPRDTSPGPTRTIQFEEQYWFHVLKQERPDWTERRGDPTLAFQQYGYYAQFLVLASGIQWAGPDLTPESFAQALQGLTYPNPLVGQSPWWQPSARFGPGDHSLNSDHALAWFDAPTSQEEQARIRQKQFCYVGGGSRFTASTMRADADDLFFDPQAGCR